MLDRTKAEVSALVGEMTPSSEMPTEEVPGEFVFSMTRETPDEVHSWPNATLGTGFRHLVLKFQDGRLMGFHWAQNR